MMAECGLVDVTPTILEAVGIAGPEGNTRTLAVGNDEGEDGGEDAGPGADAGADGRATKTCRKRS